MDIPVDLLEKCRLLWDINNNLSQELTLIGDEALRNDENRLTAMKNHARTWSRQELLNYHMGNVNQSFGIFTVAMEQGTSKIKMLKYLLDQGTPSRLEVALRDMAEMKEVLHTDDIKWWYIQNQYEFWDRMTTEELYEI